MACCVQFDLECSIEVPEQCIKLVCTFLERSLPDALGISDDEWSEIFEPALEWYQNHNRFIRNHSAPIAAKRAGFYTNSELLTSHNAIAFNAC